MAKLSTLFIALLLFLGPAFARAGGIYEASAGSGVRWVPSPVERIPTNLMLTGGYSFAGVLKLELGVVGNLGDVKSSKFDLDLRPMVVIRRPSSPSTSAVSWASPAWYRGPSRSTTAEPWEPAWGRSGWARSSRPEPSPEDQESAASTRTPGSPKGGWASISTESFQ